MEKLTAKKASRMWSTAVRLAASALADEGTSSFIDRHELVQVAAAFVASGLVSADREALVTRGANRQQDEVLDARARAYGE